MRPAVLLLALPAALSAQTAARGTPIGSWKIEYDHTARGMHGEPTQRHEHARISLRSVGDSVIGELMIGDSATANRSLLRGVAGKAGWTVYAEEPPAKGFGIMFSALGAAMDWLKEAVHGVQPVVVRFDVVAKGDSLSGTRSLTGGMGGARSSPVSGQRIK
jgi:hypothetical protein